MVWTCVHNSDSGIDVGVYESEKAAYDYFAHLIRTFWWGELRELAKDQEIMDSNTDLFFPEDPYEDDVAVVEAYKQVFGKQEDDNYRTVEIEPHKIKRMATR
jgi:hypothetical protein